MPPEGLVAHMDLEASAGSPAARRLTRRGFLGTAAGAAGAIAAAPLLAACGSSAPAKTGSTTQTQLSKILPAYQPRSIAGLTPDFPSINGTAPGYLNYPTTLAHTVTGVPGSGGTYTGTAPYWGSIPRTSGNTYYQAVNEALGATLNLQPANGNLIITSLPPLFAGRKLPDWIDVPTWAQPPGFGQATQSQLADLTSYLSGGNIRQYPNLAAIESVGWQQGVWNDRIYGIPTVVQQFTCGFYLFYRADILDKLGIGTPSIKSAADLLALGKEINNPNAKRWAFDDIWGYLYQPFGIPAGAGTTAGWTTNSKGDLITQYETENIIEAMNWERQLFQQGLVNPDSVAGQTSTAKNRFYAGDMLIYADGPGAWNYSDAIAGAAADKGYVRAAFPFFAASGGTPKMPLAPPTEYLSYFNKNLKPDQIRELLRIADYLAAPFGSYEFTLINYGKADVDYTMGSNGPVLTATGQKDVDSGAAVLLASPNNINNNPGYPAVTTASAQFATQNARYAYKPLFYAMNITVPNDLTTANAFGPFVSPTNNIMYEVVRGRSSIADYQSTVNEWLRNGGTRLKAFYETVRSKYGTA
jgi:putative aldouronate transport system substrate-binding protein